MSCSTDHTTRRPGDRGGRSHSRLGLLVGAGLAIGASAPLLAPAAQVGAHGGDYSLDFIASAPYTYNHDTGGGAYDDRTIGVDKDTVESLEGGDFECGDLVTYLTRIRRNTDLGGNGAETLKLDYTFLADTTGQSGVAMDDVVNVQINSGNIARWPGDTIVGGDPAGPDGGTDDLDSGHVDTGTVAAVVSWTEQLTKPAFTKGAKLKSSITVSGIDSGDSIILRIDVLLDCDATNFNPTGNLQATLDSGTVIAPNHSNRDSKLQVGAQTVPFKQIEDVYPAPTASFANLAGATTSDQLSTSFQAQSAIAFSGSPAPAGFSAAPAAQSAVRAPSTLPATGSSQTLGLLQLAMIGVTAGAVALVASHRRSRTAR